eukprot:7369028-Alexandrium_andersonii.AAC.1
MLTVAGRERALFCSRGENARTLLHERASRRSTHERETRARPCCIAARGRRRLAEQRRGPRTPTRAAWNEPLPGEDEGEGVVPRAKGPRRGPAFARAARALRAKCPYF